LEAFLERLNGLSSWEIYLLVAALLLQGAVFTVFPEEVIILALGTLWAAGRVDPLGSLLTVQLGLLPANAALFLAGKHIGLPLLDRAPFCWLLKRGHVDRASERVRRHGPGIVALTRFTPLVRGPIYFACGVSGMSLARFVAADAAASLAHIPLLLLIGNQLLMAPA
jgi:membrane-associated protein